MTTKRPNQVEQLLERLNVTETQCALYKADFESERNDRQRIHQELTDELEIVRLECAELKESLDREKILSATRLQNLTELERNNAQLKQTNARLLGSVREPERYGRMQDDIEILTAQVNAYSERCDEIKRALTNSEDKRRELKKKIDPMTEQVERAKAQEEELISLRLRVTRYERLLRDRNINSTEVTELKEELVTTKQQLEFLLVTYQQKKDECDNLKKEFDDLQEMNTRLKAANLVLSSKIQNTPLSPSSPLASKSQPSFPSSQYEGTPQSTGQLSIYSNEDTPPAMTQEEMLLRFGGQPLQQNYATPHPQTEREREEEERKKIREDADRALKEVEQMRKQEDAYMPPVLRQKPQPLPRKKSFNKKSEENSSQNVGAENDNHVFRKHTPIQKTQSCNSDYFERHVPYTYIPTEQIKVPPQCSEQDLKKKFGPNRFRDERREDRGGERKRSPSYPWGNNVCDRELTRRYSPQDRGANFLLQEEGREEEKREEEKPMPFDPFNAQIHKEVQEKAQWVRNQSKRPTTAEVEDNDSSLPYDPNLVCPKCGKRYDIRGIQKLRRHVKELCPLLEKK